MESEHANAQTGTDTTGARIDLEAATMLLDLSDLHEDISRDGLRQGNIVTTRALLLACLALDLTELFQESILAGSRGSLGIDLRQLGLDIFHELSLHGQGTELELRQISSGVAAGVGRARVVTGDPLVFGGQLVVGHAGSIHEAGERVGVEIAAFDGLDVTSHLEEVGDLANGGVLGLALEEYDQAAVGERAEGDAVAAGGVQDGDGVDVEMFGEADAGEDAKVGGVLDGEVVLVGVEEGLAVVGGAAFGDLEEDVYEEGPEEALELRLGGQCQWGSNWKWGEGLQWVPCRSRGSDRRMP